MQRSGLKKAPNKSESTSQDRPGDRQQAFDNFTHHQSSDFEYSEAVDLTSDVQISFSQSPSTSYPDPTFQTSSTRPYFRYPPGFQSPIEPPLSAQSYRSSQVYSQLFQRRMSSLQR